MKKLSDFWYHYKWFVIALSVLAVVGLVLAAQTCRRREAFDCALLYAGPSAVSAPAKEELKQTASSASGAAVDLYHYAVSFASGSSGTTYEALTNFDAEIQSGEALILLLSPDLYARVAEQSAVVPLDGYLPPSAAVEFADETHRAVRLSSLPLYGTPGFSALPADTLVCLRGPVSVGSLFRRGRAERRYRTAEDVLRALLAAAPETETETASETAP